MASERFFRAVSQGFTANGTASGVIKVATTAGFKVKAVVTVQSSTQQTITAEIKRIPDIFTIEVGPQGADMDTRFNLAAYTLADGAFVRQGRQRRPSIGPGEIDRATYEEEPTVARRVILVDQVGNLYGPDNPVNTDPPLDVLYDQENNIFYMGEAQPGTPESAAGWRIRRTTKQPNGDYVTQFVGNGAFNYAWTDRTMLLDPVTEIPFFARGWEKLIPLMSNANWMKLADFETITPSFADDTATLEYRTNGTSLGKAFVRFANELDWDIRLERYICNDNGSPLLDDDGTPLFLD